MHYNPLSKTDYFEKINILTNRIIVNALQSERGDLIREMKDWALLMMMESVFRAVLNKLEEKSQRAYDYFVADQLAKFEPILDAEIEEEVSAFFEVNGKLQYREVKIKKPIDLGF